MKIDIVEKYKESLEKNKEPKKKVYNKYYLSGDEDYCKLVFKEEKFSELGKMVLDTNTSIEEINSKIEIVDSIFNTIYFEDIDNVFTPEFDMIDSLRHELNILKNIVLSKSNK